MSTTTLSRMASPGSVNLSALDKRFASTCCSRTSSPTTTSSASQRVSSRTPLSSAWRKNMLCRRSASERRRSGAVSMRILSFSIFDISRMSFTSDSRNWADMLIFSRLERMDGVASPDSDATLESPMMAFIGVRISWDMRERKSVFARPISSTFSSFISIMRLRTFATDTTMTIAPTNRHSTRLNATTSKGFSETSA